MRVLELNLTPDCKSTARIIKIDYLPFHNSFIADDGECFTTEVSDNILHIGKFPVLLKVRSSVKLDIFTLECRFR
jgi:hypothetical protein